MKILVAVDGSQTSLEAVEWLVRHVGNLREPPTVELVTVHQPVSALARAAMRIKPAELAQWYHEQGEANLAKARKKLERAGLRLRAHVLVGPVAETLVRHAAQAKCGLIVVGSRGMGAAGSLLAASVASKVLHLAKIPVLLAR